MNRTEAAREQMYERAKDFIKAIDREHYPEGFMSGGGDRPIKYREMADFALSVASEQSALDVAKAVKEERDRLVKDLDQVYWNGGQAKDFDDWIQKEFAKELENKNAG